MSSRYPDPSVTARALFEALWPEPMRRLIVSDVPGGIAVISATFDVIVDVGVAGIPMAPGHYTELFFLDEPTALAAGHRPCARCRCAAFLAFATAWARAAGLAALPTAPEIDAALALERGTRLLVDPADLPDGAIVSEQDGKSCWLIDDGCKYRWSVGGYGPLEALPRTAMVALTSPSIIAVLRAGYMSLRLQPPSNVTATSPTSGRSVDR